MKVVSRSWWYIPRVQFLNSMRGPLSVAAAVFHFFEYVVGAPSDGFGAAACTVVTLS